MNIASVIVDIPTQALDTPYSYAVPDEMLVGEGGRPAAVAGGHARRSDWLKYTSDAADHL